MPDEAIYTERIAHRFMAVAMLQGRCAELLNGLANGGAITLSADGEDFFVIPADMLDELAQGL